LISVRHASPTVTLSAPGQKMPSRDFLPAARGLAAEGEGDPSRAVEDAAVFLNEWRGRIEVLPHVDLETSHHFPNGVVKSSRKYLNTQSSGLGAAWPKPQMEASRIASDNSISSPSFHGPFCISLTAFSVPTRHGVH